MSAREAFHQLCRDLVPCHLGGLLAAVALIVASAPACAFVGEAYLRIPDMDGGWQGQTHKNWVRVEGRYWGRDSYAHANGTGRRRLSVYTGPLAPRQGASQLMISVAKQSPALASLMSQCARKAKYPEVSFAESADDFRSVATDVGPRPAIVPAYFEYTLKDARLTECPLVPDAPEQAFVFEFGGIDWINYHDTEPQVDVTLQPATLASAQSSGKHKVFAVSWLGFAHDVSADQCPQMSSKPRQTESRVVAKADDAGKEGGASHLRMEYRGRTHMSVCLLPGVEPDPGNAAPATKIARGFDLDGDDGTGPPAAGTCKHKNYETEDGRHGIDNQFYTAAACIAGLQGHKGLWQQSVNEERRNGLISLLLLISGIDDERNDDAVDVTVLYSHDPLVKDASGAIVLPDYTFRVSDDPDFTHFFARVHGRIVNGVIETEPLERLNFNLIMGTDLRLASARMRLEVLPDGNLKGVLGGYEDWRYLANYYDSVGFEMTFGFQCPGFYNALKRSADGLKDSETGECNGISVAYDIEAAPAFIPDSQLDALLARPAQSGRQALR